MGASASQDLRYGEVPAAAAMSAKGTAEPTPRLADAIGAISLATELAAGLPPECALASSVLAVRMGEMCGLPVEELRATYYATAIRFIGCTSTAMEGAGVALGQDQALNYSLLMCDWTDPDEVQSSVRRHLARDAPQADREVAFRTIGEMHGSIPGLAAFHCRQALALTSRLPVPEQVTVVLRHMFDRWDGATSGARGAEIPLPARIIPLAVAAELFRRAGGAEAAIAAVVGGADGQFDPELCTLFARHARDLLPHPGDGSLWAAYLEAEPTPCAALAPGELTALAEALADLVDQKSPWMMGHSRRVAALVARAAEALGLPSAARNELCLTALVHDVGRVAIPNAIWDKPGPLTWIERRQMETHSFHTGEILARSSAFRPIAERSSMAHERADGSGYHRGLQLADPGAALLAAADVYDALTRPRSWRPALTQGEAERTLLQEVSSGRLPREAVGAVLSLAGHGTFDATPLPAGLTPREADVLLLLAKGCSDKAIAARLEISTKTVGHHAGSIYRKTGARGRVEAALFALQNRALLE